MSNPFGAFYSFQLVFLLICAIVYYKLADVENESGILWAGLSIGVFLLTWLVLHWAFPGNLMGQLALFAAITLHRVWRDSRKKD